MIDLKKGTLSLEQGLFSRDNSLRIGSLFNSQT